MRKFGILLATILLAGCATLVAAANTVLSDIQAVCGAVVNDANGGIEQLISTFPAGTQALTIATYACTYIDTIQPIPAPPASAHLRRFKGVLQQTVVVNGATINFIKP